MGLETSCVDIAKVCAAANLPNSSWDGFRGNQTTLKWAVTALTASESRCPGVATWKADRSDGFGFPVDVRTVAVTFAVVTSRGARTW